MRVLLVDDSNAMRTIQRRTLEHLGIYEIVEAADGVEALALMAQKPPDILITDGPMPNLDGLELVRRVRRTHKDLWIIMVSNDAERDRVLEAIQAGVNDYLIKPFAPEALSAKIQRILDGKV